MKKKLRRTVAAALSVFLMAGVVLPVEASAQESPYDPITHLDDAYSYAYGGLLDLRLLNDWLTIGAPPRALSAAELKGVEQLWKSVLNNDSNAEASRIKLEALEVIHLELPHISLPLIGEGGLLEFVLNDASVGVLREYAHAPSAAHAHGAAGVVSDSGGLELTEPGQGKSASVDILSLLDLGGSPFITDHVISEAALELGAISAVAINPDDSKFPDYEVTCDPDAGLTATDIRDLADPEAVPEIICHGYQIADAIVVLDSPLVESVVSGLKDQLLLLLNGVNSTLGEGGTLDTVTDLLTILGITLKVNVDVPSDGALLDALITAPLEDESGLVSIDLGTGKITLDLKKLHSGSLNNLSPNTSLLDSTQHINQITETVTSLLTDPASKNENGLNARLENILKGSGGLYDLKVNLELRSAVCLPVVGCPIDAQIHGTVRELLDAEYHIETGTLGDLLGGLLKPTFDALLVRVGKLVEALLFGDGVGLLGGVVGNLQEFLGTLLTPLGPVLEEVLKPLLNIIINRQFRTEETYGTVFTVSALEVNVGDLNTNGEIIHLPLATASVMAQPPITMDLDVAMVGDGRNLHTGGYTYDLLCTLGTGENLRTVANKSGLQYAEANLGDGFFFETDELSLTNAIGGIEPFRITPGAECTVTATSPDLNEPHEALRPTGNEPGTRTPYTYFLDVDRTEGVRISGETPTDGPTLMTPIGLTEEGPVNVDTTAVGDEWKHHAFTFIVPPGEKTHRVNIVHAYDIDRRDIILSKIVTGPAPEGADYAFEYSLDNGATWLPEETDGPISIPAGSSFTIEDVPVLDLDALNADPSVEVPTEVMIREELGAEETGPVVSWILDEDSLSPLSSDDDGYDANFATASFTAGPVAAPSTVPTPKNLGVTNSYAAITVDKHIDGELGTLDNTTLIPEDATKMTIRYTVKNTGAVPLETIRIFDESLVNELFTRPAGITVDSGTGEVSGCALAFGQDGEDATCSFEVTLNDPDTEKFFHYKADEAEVEAVATVTVDGRTITATDTDNHGAMRLPGILGQLPATGVTTLVWVMALGLIAALTALALYVRSRRK